MAADILPSCSLAIQDGHVTEILESDWPSEISPSDDVITSGNPGDFPGRRRSGGGVAAEVPSTHIHPNNQPLHPATPTPTHLPTHPYTYPPTNPPLHPPTPIATHLPLHLCTPPPTHPSTNPSTPTPTHPPLHSPTLRLPTYPYTHPPTPTATPTPTHPPLHPSNPTPQVGAGVVRGRCRGS